MLPSSQAISSEGAWDCQLRRHPASQDYTPGTVGRPYNAEATAVCLPGIIGGLGARLVWEAAWDIAVDDALEGGE